MGAKELKYESGLDKIGDGREVKVIKFKMIPIKWEEVEVYMEVYVNRSEHPDN